MLMRMGTCNELVLIHFQIEALKSENYRLGNDHRRVSNDFQEMQEKNIHLHQQVYITSEGKAMQSAHFFHFHYSCSYEHEI